MNNEHLDCSEITSAIIETLQKALWKLPSWSDQVQVVVSENDDSAPAAKASWLISVEATTLTATRDHPEVRVPRYHAGFGLYEPEKWHTDAGRAEITKRINRAVEDVTAHLRRSLG